MNASPLIFLTEFGLLDVRDKAGDPVVAEIAVPGPGEILASPGRPKMDA